MPSPARLRVAAPFSRTRRPQWTGHGRVWYTVLRGLSDRVSLDYVGPDYRGSGMMRGRARRPDVWLVDGHRPSPDLPGPAVAELHEVSCETDYLRSFLEESFAQSMEACGRAAAARATAVITISESSRRQIIDALGVDAGRVHAIHPGVDCTTFRPDVAGGRALVGRPYVLFVSQLHPRKNLPSLRRAMEALADRGFPHALVIVGAPAADRDDKALDDELSAELAGHPGRVVRFLAPIPERRLAALMAGADAYCMPSFAEGFGMGALEAMACGTPVVVSNRASLPEVVGEAGLVVEPAWEALAEALARVLSDPALASRLGREGRLRAETFSWSRTVEGWYSVIEQAACS